MMVVAFTGSTGEFVAWAWERHHNVLSWYIRPLFLLPFCFFAYKRSLWGMTLTLLALATSMFWFPAPGEASPAVKEMPAAGRADAAGNWRAGGGGRAARATSVFWAPAPGEASPAVKEMLAAEREYLTANWTLWKVLIALVVPATLAALGLAVWKRPPAYGVAGINAAGLARGGWTFVFGTEAGAMSPLPAALL